MNPVRVCDSLDGPRGDGIREAEWAEVAKGIVGHKLPVGNVERPPGSCRS
jgi:hypothetical protein